MERNKPLTMQRSIRIKTELDELITKELGVHRRNGLRVTRATIINSALHEYYRRRRTRKIA